MAASQGNNKTKEKIDEKIRDKAASPHPSLSCEMKKMNNYYGLPTASGI